MRGGGEGIGRETVPAKTTLVHCELWIESGDGLFLELKHGNIFFDADGRRSLRTNMYTRCVIPHKYL